MTENELISKELYRKVKTMSREELLALIGKVSAAGKRDALKEMNAKHIDLEKIRSELKEIKGLGEERADKIINILEKNCHKGEYTGWETRSHLTGKHTAE